MSSKLLFYYLGDDEAYFRALQGEFRGHAKAAIEFKRISENTDTKIQSLFLKVFNNKPACVFIDFSKHTQDYFHLARLISRTPLEHSLLIVGLVDYLSPVEVLNESIATGSHLTFIKSAETYDVAFSVVKIVDPSSVGEHGFASAALKETQEVGTICKVGYIHSEGVHIETDYNLSKGDRIDLRHFWMDKKLVPSRQMFVKETSTNNMFYQFKQNADLDFIFVDEYIPPEGLSGEEAKAKIAEREDMVRVHKKNLRKWIEDNMASSQEKRAKLLVVDNKFTFYNDQPRTDKHPYTIRCIPFFNDIAAEMTRLQPQIIAMNLDNEPNGKNTIDSLRQLVTTLKAKFTDLDPYIIAFGCSESSQDLQAALQHPNTLTHKEELSPDLLIKMTDVLQKKLAARPPKGTQDTRNKVFMKKTNMASIAEIIKTVTIVKLSETDMILQSDFTFPAGTNIHFKNPVDMFVNLQPNPKPSGKIPEYIGLIHCIGENEKKELRRFVNSVFFRDHDAQVSAETEEFKKLNELKLQEKVDALAKAQAEAEKAAAEGGESGEVAEKAKDPQVS